MLATTEIRKQKSLAFCYPVYSSQTLNNGLMGYYNKYNFENAITWTTDGANAGTTRYRTGKFYCTNVCGVLSSSEGFANLCMAEIINRETPKYVSYVGNPKLMSNVVADILIPLPPLSEQHAIANTLAVFDNHINNLSELIAKKKAIRDGALNDLMTGRTRLKGFCSAWEVKKLGDIGVVKMCRRIFQHQTKPFGQIPFYKIGTFGGKSDAYISRELYENYKRLYPYPKVGDILLSAAGTIGRAVMFDGRDSYFQDSNIVWLDVNHDILCNKFLMYFYQAHKWQNLEGTTIRRLYNSIILDTQIPLPSLTEQQAIADTLTAFDNEILALESERDKIIQIRDGAMNDLLTGKVRLC